jgi:hypothetical protein
MSSALAKPRTVHAAGPRPTPRELLCELLDVAIALPLFATAPALRRWHRRWGATDAEVAAEMPGDHLAPGCQFSCTRAITIAAPPQAVWPWLVQVGYGRAGFYSNDLLDNAGRPSSKQIISELQHSNVGDWVPMYRRVSDSTAFRVAAFAEAEHLVWSKPDSTWAWTLTPVAGGTRLVTRLRLRYRWSRPGRALLSLLLTELGDFPMMRKMLRTLKQRAEALAAAQAPAGRRRPGLAAGRDARAGRLPARGARPAASGRGRRRPRRRVHGPAAGGPARGPRHAGRKGRRRGGQ